MSEKKNLMMINRGYLGKKIAYKIQEIESLNKEIEEYNKNDIIELSKSNAEITIAEKEYSRSSIILEYISKTLETFLEKRVSLNQQKQICKELINKIAELNKYTTSYKN